METAGVKFLVRKYNLNNAPEVSDAARRTESRTGEKVSQDPGNRVRNYLARFEEISSLSDPRDRDGSLEALKKVLHNRFVIKPEDIPESYFRLQERILRERGQGGDWDSLLEDQKKAVFKQASDALIADQRTSLDTWIDYFASPDAPYPTWLKYYATRSILGMASYDKDRKTFPNRSKETTKPFPELNREALSYVLDLIERKYSKKDQDLSAFEEADRKKLQELLNGENFAKLYAWAIEKVTPTSVDKLKITTGEWIVYPRRSDPNKLAASIQGYGTGWCTAGVSTAQKQLEGGDFYVYYSHDRSGKPTIPRVAIRMEDKNIAEVRGISEDQNLDPYIGEIVQAKLKEFPDGKKYEKRVENMKVLTEIEKKTIQGQDLSRDDLRFLYEIDEKIEGFGFKRDPRISTILARRDPKIDVPIIFECLSSEVAWGKDNITPDTKVYIGPIIPSIFSTIENLDQIYLSFPERSLNHTSLKIGGRTVADLDNSLKESEELGFGYSDGARKIVHAKEFKTVSPQKTVDLVVLRLGDLGLDARTGIKKINETARKFGLETCTAEVGPAVYLSYVSSGKFESSESQHIAMDPITDIDGLPRIFWIFGTRKRNQGKSLSLYYDYGESEAGWNPDSEFVFMVPR